METLSWLLAGYFTFCIFVPLAWWPRSRFVKRVVWSGMPVRLYKAVLPHGAGACAVWAYGARCVILDAEWIEEAGVEEISHILRHECGHLVIGHARTNTLLCASGLWFMLPWFRARQEYEAEVFAAMCKDERVISI